MSTGQNQWCVVKVVANAAAGCAIKLRMYRAGVFWPRKLCISFSISHDAQVRSTIVYKKQISGRQRTMK